MNIKVQFLNFWVTVAISFLLLLMFSFSISGQTFNLVDVPCPYSFDRLDCSESNVFWRLSGNGNIRVTDKFGQDEQYSITKVNLNGVYFPTLEKGWVVGSNGNIFYTRNRGRNWVKQKSGVKTSLEGVYCVSGKECFAIGYAGVILHTINNGQNWKQQKSETSKRLLAVHFVNAAVGWVVGENGTILKTEDGGNTWKNQKVTKLISYESLNESSNFYFLDVHFIDKYNGWIAGNDGIASTKNGGKVWEYNKLDTAIIGVVSKDGKEIFAISRNGKNYYSDDGGITWSKR